MSDGVKLLLDFFYIMKVDCGQSVEFFYPLPVALDTLIEGRLVDVLNDQFYVPLDVIFHDLDLLQGFRDNVLIVDWQLLVVIKHFFQQFPALNPVKLYDLLYFVHLSFKNFSCLSIDLFDALFARGRLLQIELALVNAAEKDLQDLELRMPFKVGVTRYHGAALANIQSSATVSGVYTLKFNGKALTFKFIGAFLTVEQVFAFNVDAISALKFLMIFAMSFEDLARPSAFGSLPRKTQRRLRVIMRRQGFFGGGPSWRS